jgi:hypothetical protein
LVPTPHQLQLADTVMMQPYGISKDVLIEFQDSWTLVDFMVMDMDPHQQTSIILGKPFLKSIRVTIDKTRGIINMKVDRVHEKFIYHPKNISVLLPDLSPPIRMHGRARCGSNKKRAGTRYIKLVFLYPMGSMGHVVRASASRVRKINSLFI